MRRLLLTTAIGAFVAAPAAAQDAIIVDTPPPGPSTGDAVLVPTDEGGTKGDTAASDAGSTNSGSAGSDVTRADETSGQETPDGDQDVRVSTDTGDAAAAGDEAGDSFLAADGVAFQDLTPGDLRGAPIHGTDGSEVGSVAEVLTTEHDGFVRAIVGELDGRRVELSQMNADVRSVGESDYRVELTISEEMVDALPDYDQRASADAQSGDTAASVSDAQSGTTEAADTSSATGAAGAASESAEGPQAGRTGTIPGPEVSEEFVALDAVDASELEGASVFGRDGDEIGEVAGVEMFEGTDQIRSVTVNMSGSEADLGIADFFVAQEEDGYSIRVLIGEDSLGALDGQSNEG